MWFFTCIFRGIIRFSLTSALLAAFLLLGGCTAESAETDVPEYSVRYDPERDPFADGREAIRLAAASNRRILIEVGGDWCGWCRELHRLQQRDDIRRQLRQQFVVLKVNYSDDNRNAGFLSSFPEVQGFPKLYVSEKDGTILHVQDPAAFVVDGHYSHERYLEFLRRWSNA